jgi:hypothetical protein
MFPSGLRAIAAIFLRFWEGKVKDLLLRKRTVSRQQARVRGHRGTDLTKSKTDTLLPTGLSTELPSGVNIMFPCRYTVPHRFENWTDEMRSASTTFKCALPRSLPSFFGSVLSCNWTHTYAVYYVIFSRGTYPANIVGFSADPDKSIFGMRALNFTVQSCAIPISQAILPWRLTAFY